MKFKKYVKKMLKTENFHDKFDQNDLFSKLQSSIKLDLDSISNEKN